MKPKKSEKITHYNNGCPWDKKTKKPKKTTVVSLDTEVLDCDTDFYKAMKLSPHYLLSDSVVSGNTLTVKVRKPKVVANLYTAVALQPDQCTIGGDVMDIEGADYIVDSHAVTDTPYLLSVGCNWYDHLGRLVRTNHRTLKEPSLLELTATFLDTEEMLESTPHPELSLLILPEHIQTEREKKQKVGRLVNFVLERVEQATDPLHKQLNIKEKWIENRQDYIMKQREVISQQEKEIAALKARVTEFEQKRAAAESCRFIGTNNRVFVED